MLPPETDSSPKLVYECQHRVSPREGMTSVIQCTTANSKTQGQDAPEFGQRGTLLINESGCSTDRLSVGWERKLQMFYLVG